MITTDDKEIITASDTELADKTQVTILAGFPGVGRASLMAAFKERFADTPLENDLVFLDSPPFSWAKDTSEGPPITRNPDFVRDYIAAIKEASEKAQMIMVSTHEELRDELRAQDMPYTLIYPLRDLKEEYMQRYRDQEKPEYFISMMADNWDKFLDSLETDPCPKERHMVLGTGAHLMILDPNHNPEEDS